jgi:hypothetical protein
MLAAAGLMKMITPSSSSPKIPSPAASRIEVVWIRARSKAAE